MKNRVLESLPSLLLSAALLFGFVSGYLGVHSPVSSSFVDDYLLPLFFLAIGIELRGEISTGHFANRRTLLVPAIAAIAGVVLPAIIFCATTWSISVAAAIPTATDLTLGVTLLVLVRSAGTGRLRAKFLALATIDDVIGLAFIVLAFGGAIPNTLIACMIGFAIPQLAKIRKTVEALSNLVIIPVFGFVTALELQSSLSTGVNSLVLTAVLLRPIGKLVGIGVAGAWAERRFGLATQTKDWFFIGLLGGIGFTVSMFLAKVIYAADLAAQTGAIVATLAAAGLSALAYVLLASRSARRGHLGAK